MLPTPDILSRSTIRLSPEPLPSRLSITAGTSRVHAAKDGKDVGAELESNNCFLALKEKRSWQLASAKSLFLHIATPIIQN